MKKAIFTFVLSTLSLFLFAQTDEVAENKKEKKLTPIEIEINKGGLIIPDIGLNFYLSEKTILRIQSARAGYAQMGNTVSHSVAELSAFLEFRKYTGEKLFLSHGPTAGYAFKKRDNIDSHYAKAGYNFGVGYRISKHLTGGTYISPYVSFEDGDITVLQGRIFTGALSNIYLAYRF